MDVMKEIGGAKPLQTRADRIKTGVHIVALKTYATRKTRNNGTILAADLVVVKSEAHVPGTVVGCPWFIQEQTEWMRENEFSRAQAFIKSVIQCLNPENKKPTQEEIEKFGTNLLDEKQPGRGILLKCIGSAPRGESGFVEVSWEPVPQTTDTIKKMRAKIEESMPAAKEPEPPKQDNTFGDLDLDL